MKEVLDVLRVVECRRGRRGFGRFLLVPRFSWVDTWTNASARLAISPKEPYP